MQSFGADVVVEDDYIAVHLYEHDGNSFQYSSSQKCLNFDEVTELLFKKRNIGYFREVTVYLEETSRTEEVNGFLKKAKKELNWLVIGGQFQIGMTSLPFKKPTFIEVKF